MDFMLGQLLKRSVRRALVSPVFAPVTSLYRGCLTILTYHRIAPDAPLTRETVNNSFQPNREMFVSVERFDEQMAFLSTHCDPLSLGEAVEGLRSGDLPRRAVVVTFDDGYHDNYALGLPVLEHYGVPATIFVTTGLIDRSIALWWFELEAAIRARDEIALSWNDRDYFFRIRSPGEKFAAFRDLARLFGTVNQEEFHELLEALRESVKLDYCYEGEMMKWDEIRALDRHSLITLGAHTSCHPALGKLPAQELERELCTSKSFLEERLGHAVRCLSYPYGFQAQAGPREFRAAERAGYECAVTARCAHVQWEHQHHLFALPRIDVHHFDTLYSFQQKLAGVESLIQQRGRRFVTN